MIRILYLYHDLMTLYGDNGNIRVLERYLKDQGEDVTIDRRSVGHTLDISSYDFIYCGCGMERSRNAALKHLISYKEDMKKAFSEGKVILFTGNAWQMLGNSIKTAEGDKLEGLGLFDFDVIEQSEKRYVGDVLGHVKGFEEIFVGFINRCSHVDNLTDPYMTIDKVIGNIPDKYDGIHQNNLFGVSLNGPLLVKNPHFARMIVSLLVKDYKPIDYENERRGYQTTISELSSDMEKHL